MALIGLSFGNVQGTTEHRLRTTAPRTEQLHSTERPSINFLRFFFNWRKFTEIQLTISAFLFDFFLLLPYVTKNFPESILPNFHFSVFPIFAVNLGHIIITTFFSYVTNTQAYQRKNEKFFLSEEIKFGRIDSWTQSYKTYKIYYDALLQC